MIFAYTAIKSENKYDKVDFSTKSKKKVMHFTVQNSRLVFKRYLAKSWMGDKMGRFK